MIKLSRTMLALPITAILFTSTLALAEMPVVQHEGNITYITGGIGERETEALRAERHKYALRIVSAGAKGAFRGDTHIIIRDSKGAELLSTNAGPLFYANLPKGKYTIESTTENESKRQAVTVGSKKQVTARFVWKAVESPHS